MKVLNDPQFALPLVVQVAFSGKRNFFASGAERDSEDIEFLNSVERELTHRLRDLRTELGMTSQHHVCGISSLAAGGDLVFTRACANLNWPQRIFLPQPRDEFFSALGSEGADFSSGQQAAARELLAGTNIIETRVASASEDRTTRFEDVNLELVRVCDILICLLPHDSGADRVAGTRRLLDLAKRWHKPVLELRVIKESDGTVRLKSTWHPLTNADRRLQFTPPTLPRLFHAIDGRNCTLSDGAAYRVALKQFASASSMKLQWYVRKAALVVVLAHVTATMFSLVASTLKHAEPKDAKPLGVLFGVELVLLAVGLSVHTRLHNVKAVQDWAMTRLVAEIARSAAALSRVRRPLRHFFDTQLPLELRPLLRTLNVVHLAESRSVRDDWKTHCKTYVEERLSNRNGGQLDYYEHRHARATRLLRIARSVFVVSSCGAMIAAAIELADASGRGSLFHAVDGLMGPLAVLLPVVGVAALSLAAAFDLEARVHTYDKMCDFLRTQIALLNEVATENEFATLAMQTEARLLGETAHWYARRSFTGVA